MARMCASCPSGCGPFRNLESMVRPLQRDYTTWPVNHTLLDLIRAAYVFYGLNI